MSWKNVFRWACAHRNTCFHNAQWLVSTSPYTRGFRAYSTDSSSTDDSGAGYAAKCEAITRDLSSDGRSAGNMPLVSLVTVTLVISLLAAVAQEDNIDEETVHTLCGAQCLAKCTDERTVPVSFIKVKFDFVIVVVFVLLLFCVFCFIVVFVFCFFKASFSLIYLHIRLV